MCREQIGRSLGQLTDGRQTMSKSAMKGNLWLEGIEKGVLTLFLPQLLCCLLLAVYKSLSQVVSQNVLQLCVYVYVCVCVCVCACVCVHPCVHV